MNIRFTNLSAYTKSTYLMLTLIIIISSAAGLTYAASPEPDEPKAEISAQASEYAHTASPVFNFQTGSNKYYQVQLALAKPVFTMSSTDPYKITSGDRQNFYSTDWLECSGDPINILAASANPSTCENGQGTFTLTSTIWSNLRASVVYYRLITNSIESDSGALISDIGSVGRTGETWYGLPLNDKAKAGTYSVVVNGVLQGIAIESDFGPRDASGTRFHPGLDFAVPIGTPVYAFEDGKVNSIPGKNAENNRVNIYHSNGNYYSAYLHLSSWLVKAGDEVKSGQLIGYSGDWVYGQHGQAHLHFEAGYTSQQRFYNPLHRLTHTDTHEVKADNTTFREDNATHNNAIDVADVSGDQDKMFIGFGITTDFDKDLNYVRVQIDSSSSQGQYFEMDYDQVMDQDTATGIVTIGEGGNATYFLVHRSNYDIFGDSNFDKTCKDEQKHCGMHVIPTITWKGKKATDYFYFPWDLTPFMNEDDGGHHTIHVTIGEVNGRKITRDLVIGPEISLIEGPSVDGNSISYKFNLTNHDYQAGIINLEVKGLPEGWQESFIGNTTSIPANGSVTIALTFFTPDGDADPELLNASNTRVVATFDRIPALKDTAELCPKVWIDSPDQGAEFTEGDVVPVTVKIRSGLTATDVRLSVAGGQPIPMTHQGDNTWTYQWTTSQISEYVKEFSLQAIATIQGISGSQYSKIVDVTVKQKTETKIVTILDPDDGQEVKPGEVVNAEVFADLGVTDVQLTIDGQAQPLAKEGDTKYTTTWTVPSSATEGTEYELKASGKYNGQPLSSASVAIKVVIPQNDPNPVKFLEPDDGQNVIFAQSNNDVVPIRVEAPNADYVTLTISPDDTNQIWMTEDPQGSGIWVFNDWTPDDEYGDGVEIYTLAANSVLPNNQGSKLETIIVYGKSGGDNDTENPQVTFLNISQDQVLTQNFPIQVRATDNGGVTLVGLEISSCGEKVDLDQPVSCGADCYEFSWNPWKKGQYSFQADVMDTSGNIGSSVVYANVDIAGLETCEDTIQINQHAFLRYIWNLKFDRYWGGPSATYNTGIPSNDYVCSVIGFSARKGDIGEKYHDYIFRMYLKAETVYPYTYDTWQLMADFNTIATTWTGSRWYDDFETWDITLLCISTEVASIDGPQPGKEFFIKTLPSLGDNVGSKTYYDTGYRFDQYACGIAGFNSGKGDINENSGGDILHTNLYRSNSTWWVRADFKTHNDNENWTVDILCISRDIASIDGPVPDRSYFIQEYFNLGDNVGSPSNTIDTGYSIDDYVCGVIGFAAKSGDINEDISSGPLKTHLDPTNGTWHIRADFITHNNDNENWDIKILCALKDGGTHVSWNESHEETYSESCIGRGTNCQVLRYESLNLTGPVILKGGGYTGSPSARDNQICNYDQIAVYINNRDPSTGKTRWTQPICMKDGDSITLSPNTTYEFRGVSIVGGSTIPFRLADPNAPLTNLSAEPTLFTTRDANNVLYGPGMALTWEETYHPEAKYYEIQYSEDGGATWQILNNQRDKNIGGWINHHGWNVPCGHDFGHCLKPLQNYSYRVRVLGTRMENNVEVKYPLTDWSDVVTVTSLDWPANVEVEIEPYAKGLIYPSPSVVTLSLTNVHGDNLYIDWEIPSLGVQHEILEGCTDGYFSQNQNTRTCKLRIWVDESGNAFNMGSGGKLAAPLMALPYAEVVVKGTDSLGFEVRKDIVLYVDKNLNDPDPTFSDVSENHWAHPYIQYLHDQGFISGCSVVGDPMFCPEDPITRDQQAVILVRAEHPEEPGYVPQEVEPAVVPFIDVQDKMAIEVVEGSTTPPVSYWGGKWIAELYDLGLTAGCSEDPPLYCPEMAVTRAQMAVFAVKLHMGEDFKPGDPPYQPFNDVTLYDENGEVTWQARWIMAARSNGLVQNCGTDMEAMLFFPEKEATRAEMACMVYHALTNEWNDIVPPD